MSTPLKFRAALAATLFVMALSQASASVVLTGTRVVYPAKEREVTLKLSNEGNAPALVQAWIDDGNPNAMPDDSKTPFTLTPPLFRLDPKKGQTLRIIYLQEPLPVDRESLFWLNVLEVPPLPTSKDEAPHSALQLAFRTRVKLFFRPSGLVGNADIAPDKIVWQVVRKDNGSQVLKATNPTPYHITFTRIEVTAQRQVYRNEQGGMIAPGADAEFGIGDVTTPITGPYEIRYTTLNDFGAGVDGVSQGSSTRSAKE